MIKVQERLCYKSRKLHQRQHPGFIFIHAKAGMLAADYIIPSGFKVA